MGTVAKPAARHNAAPVLCPVLPGIASATEIGSYGRFRAKAIIVHSAALKLDTTAKAPLPNVKLGSS